MKIPFQREQAREGSAARAPGIRSRFWGITGLAFAVLGVPVPGVAAAPPLPTVVVVNLSPPEAVAAGAGWRLLGEEAWRDSGVSYSDILPGSYFLEYRTIAGWRAPERDLPLQAEVSTSHNLFASYAVIPLHPVEVTATAGGFVVEEVWNPMLFDALRPPSSLDGPTGRNAEWQRDLRQGPRSRPMPANNTGWRVRLRALAFPGYEFLGWSGEASGTRNPLTLVVQRPWRIQAHFARPLTSRRLTFRAERCASPGVALIHGQFSFPAGERLDVLRCRPALPAGWRIVSVDGLGGPEVQGSDVVFGGLLGQNPVQFNLGVEVPAGESGPRTLAGEVEFRLAGEGETTVRPIEALTVAVEPSVGAQLSLELAGGKPLLTVHGVVGYTYTLEQTPLFLGPQQGRQMWAYLGDVTLTNATQVFADPFPLAPSGGVFYRATVVE